jgi:predicted RNA-binding Zn-ribbon protein involved in translation (DUF1610 family)
MSSESYENQWTEFRRRRARFFIAGAIAFAALIVGVKFAVKSGSSILVAISVIAAIAITALPGVQYIKWKCPRCGNAFLSKGLLGSIYRNHFARQCVHCKLPMGASPANGEA